MYKSLTLKISLCLILLTVMACTATSNSISSHEPISSDLADLLAINAQAFGPAIAPKTEKEIFLLSEFQKTNFLNYYNAPENIELEGHVRLHKYLLSFGDNFSYSDYTKTAELTRQTSSGNCISLAVLTTAYAKLVGLNVKYQLVKRVPIYQQFGSVVFNAEHVRTMVFESDLEIVDGVMVIPGYSLIDYYPSRYSKVDGFISKDEFISRYYRNLAAEALGENDNNKAFWLAKHSLKNVKENSDAINSLAVANRRSGQFEMAEKLFQYGLKTTNNKLALLKNYKILLKQLGRSNEVQKIDRQLTAYEDKNPFDMLNLAEQAFADNNIIRALDLYQSVIGFAPYLHQAYFGIAKSEYKRGNLIAANEALQRAMQETYDGEVRSVYKAKLSVLKNLDKN